MNIENHISRDRINEAIAIHSLGIKKHPNDVWWAMLGDNKNFLSRMRTDPIRFLFYLIKNADDFLYSVFSPILINAINKKAYPSFLDFHFESILSEKELTPIVVDRIKKASIECSIVRVLTSHIWKDDTEFRSNFILGLPGNELTPLECLNILENDSDWSKSLIAKHFGYLIKFGLASKVAELYPKEFISAYSKIPPLVGIQQDYYVFISEEESRLLTVAIENNPEYTIEHAYDLFVQFGFLDKYLAQPVIPEFVFKHCPSSLLPKDLDLNRYNATMMLRHHFLAAPLADICKWAKEQAIDAQNGL